MRRTSLNEGWEFRPKANRHAEMVGMGPPWLPVVLPHDAMIGGQRSSDGTPAAAYFPGGVWEYRRILTPNSAVRPETILEFEGVYRDALVFVDGTRVAHRPYGYSHFHVPVGHLLTADGPNEVRVEARSGSDSRWYSGAGIYRDVWLLEGGQVHIPPDGLRVHAPEVDADVAVVEVSVRVRNRGPVTVRPTVEVSLSGPSGQAAAAAQTPVSIFPGEEVTSVQRLHVYEPRRWSPDTPHLYRCSVVVSDVGGELDADTVTFGIRSLSLDPGRGLRINGEPVLLRGACVHHDNGPLGAATVARADERRVERLKEAGFNAIRSAHNPMSRAMLDACDRLGVVVMDETFDMWGQPKTDGDYAQYFEQWWEDDVESMVAKDFNHPSVVLYSIGNEVPDGSTPVGIRTARDLAKWVRQLDTTRYVTQAVSGLQVGGAQLFAEIREEAERAHTSEETGVNTAMTSLTDLIPKLMSSPVITDKTAEAFAILDVAGYNYMETRFAMDGELFPHRVVAATESHPASMDRVWAGVVDHPYVIGEFTWTGWDYLGEVGVGRTDYGPDPPPMGMGAFMGEYPWRTAWCGDIDMTGGRRPQSYFREIVYGLRSEPYIVVHRPEHRNQKVVHSGPWSWPDVIPSWTWPGHEGESMTIEVYSAADEVELYLGGRSVGCRPAGPDQRYRAVFETDYRPGTLEAVARTEGEEVGRSALRSAAEAVVLRAAVENDVVGSGTSDAAFVDIRFCDSDGTTNPTADRMVTVAVEGPGSLCGLTSADPRSEEPFTATSCTTFDGSALAVIRPTGTGTITVRVEADGCEPHTVRIEAVGPAR